MAASIQYPDFTSSPTLTNPVRLPKVPADPPRQISKFTLKPIKISSLKALCNRRKLKEALFSFTNLFTEDQDPLQFVLDEAYSSLFELCASEKSIALGRQIHARLIKCSAVYDAVFLSTSNRLSGI
ncbi:hypothetical protein RJ641_030303 [Dillenia turbinata]|uniref:Uncharacterized protein n=1 Tax=Dillenia turbinata TaxID=194707 RepID=A0AAN8ZKC1_9MAGN